MFYQQTPYYKFNTDVNTWEKITWYEEPQTLQHEEQQCRSIKIATFNVLFDLIQIIEPAIRSPDRFKYHHEVLLRSIDADVLVLQEVTVPYLGNLLNYAWLQEKYPYCSSYSSRTENNPKYDQHNYSVVIFSALPITEAYNSFTGIDIHYTRSPVCVIKYPNPTPLTFTVCAVHLKALYAFADVRGEQLDDLFQMFDVKPRTHEFFTKPPHERKNTSTRKTRRNKRKKIITPKNLPIYEFRELDNVVMAGDFNFQQEKEEDFIPPNVVDVWKLLRPNEPGYTNDPETNLMIKRKEKCREKYESAPQLRLDRICLLSKENTPTWAAHTIQMFGTEPIPLEDATDIYPSDHYGLLAEIELIK